jgi:hypothetical protein
VCPGTIMGNRHRVAGRKAGCGVFDPVYLVGNVRLLRIGADVVAVERQHDAFQRGQEGKHCLRIFTFVVGEHRAFIQMIEVAHVIELFSVPRRSRAIAGIKSWLYEGAIDALLYVFAVLVALRRVLSDVVGRILDDAKFSADQKRRNEPSICHEGIADRFILRKPLRVH